MVTLALTTLTGAGYGNDLHTRAAGGLRCNDMERLLATTRGEGGGGAHVHLIGDRIAARSHRLGIEGDDLCRTVRGAEAEDPALTRGRAAIHVDILAGNDIRIGRYAVRHAG